MFTETTIKKFWRYCIIRDAYYSLDSSGYYDKNRLHAISKASGISYNTLRQDLKHFQERGWLSIHGTKVRFKALANEYRKMWRLYNDLGGDQPPAVQHFCSQVKLTIFTDYIKRLAYYASLKISSNKEREQFMAHLFDKSHTGVLHKLPFALNNIARAFQKSKTTACRYINSLADAGLIRIRRNTELITRVPRYEDYLAIRKNTGKYGRLFWLPLTGEVRERKKNEYCFA